MRLRQRLFIIFKKYYSDGNKAVKHLSVSQQFPVTKIQVMQTNGLCDCLKDFFKHLKAEHGVCHVHLDK